MGITENAAYLKGLFDGYELDKNSKEGKIIGELISLVADMADKIEALEADNKELHEYAEELDSDLGSLEEEFYLPVDEIEDYSDLNDEEDFSFDDDEAYYEIECPHCGEKICFGDELSIETLVCPACGEQVDTVDCDDAE